MNIYFRSTEERRAAYEKIRHLPLTFAQADETSLELTAPGVSKAEGLRRLADRLGISMEETAAIGDSDNDRRMMEAVGLPVAMGNAEQEIRAICRFVTADKALLDVMPPDGNGFELCRKIREEHVFPIIMLTARSADIDKMNAAMSGGLFFFPHTITVRCPSTRFERRIIKMTSIGKRDKMVLDRIVCMYL